VRGGNQQTLRVPQHRAQVPGRHASTGKTKLPLRIPICKVPKNSVGKEMLAPPRVRYLSRGGPWGHCRYPGDQVPPRTSSRSRQKTRHANHTPLRVVNLSMNRMTRCPAPGQLRGRHVSCGLSSRYPARGSSGATTCPVASAPAAQPGAAPGPPRVLRPQLPLPSPGQLQGRHISCGLSSRCPARDSSGVATCALEAQRSACY
jgi:hypothetical protein